MCQHGVCIFFHIVEFNIRLFILKWGTGYLVHSILIRQQPWHLGEQLFSDPMLATAAVMQISWSKSRRFPIFNISAAPHSSMAAHGGRAHKNIQIIFHFSPKRHLSGSRSLVVFGIPAEARLPYQAKQVRCKVGAHGRSVSRWIPNVKAHPNPERWDTTLKLRSLEKGGRWGRRGERAPGEEKNRWQHFKAAEFCELWEIMWLLTSAEGPSGAGYHSLWTV